MTKTPKKKTPTKAKRKPQRRLPGDPNPAERLARIVRVDHAGEYGAVRIYEGQMAVLGKSASAPIIRHMAEQERRHLEKFERLVTERRVRPTVLLPLWHVAGYMLGAGTALLGERAAMACTVAVEEVIDEHYQGQLDQIAETDPELRQTVEEFRQDERDHRDTGLAQGAEQAPGYTAITGAVKAGSRLAIWLSERF
jgi:ubiquinone biosynthesis monooxygenase Coq7